MCDIGPQLHTHPPTHTVLERREWTGIPLQVSSQACTFNQPGCPDLQKCRARFLGSPFAELGKCGCCHGDQFTGLMVESILLGEEGGSVLVQPGAETTTHLQRTEPKDKR